MNTSAPSSGRLGQENVALAAFAEFISANREEITRHWVSAVDRSPRVQTSEDLTFQQLVDHLPQLCDDLAETLRTTYHADLSEDAARHSTAHGRKRWQQGYRLDELIRELSILRRDFVGRWFDWFVAQHSTFSHEQRHQARSIVHQFFDEIISGSVTQFVEEEQQRLLESQDALRAAKERAQAAERAKNNFIALVSHELRTPLTPILLSAAALARDESIPAHLREVAEMIRQNSQIEAGLIDDLLDASRLTRGSLSLSLSEIDLHGSLLNAIDFCRSEFAAKKITPKLNLLAAVSRVRGDEERLKRAVTTLVRNAINVTPDGGSVAITTWNTEGEIEITIEDMGSSLDADALERLFLPFEEGRRSTPFGLGGLSLSRYVCKAIIEAHGGKVTAHPGGQGHGAILSVRLPAME